MDKIAKIDVVIATYNGEKYLSEQIDSIVNQTLRPNRIILSDANSCDRTKEICEVKINENPNIEFVTLFHNTRLIAQENFQAGLKCCDADYVFFSDQDDVWEKNKIELTINCMERTGADLSFTDAAITDSNLCKVGSKTLWRVVGYKADSPEVIYKPRDNALLKQLIKANIATGMTMCLKRRILSWIMPIPKSCLHDSWSILVASQVGVIVAINEATVNYRQHGCNQVGVKNSFATMIKHGENYRKSIDERISTIECLLDRVGTDAGEKNNETMRGYLSFLFKRKNYLDSSHLWITELPSSKDYSYYCNGIAIQVKDILARCFFGGHK